MKKKVVKNNPKNHNSEWIRLDTDRKSRCGFPEAVFGQGKSIEQLIEITKRFIKNKQNLLITRLSKHKATILQREFPGGFYDENAKIFMLKNQETPPKNNNIKIVTAGTTDISVALEAKYSLEIEGYNGNIIADVGVAGIHRLQHVIPELKKADVIIVVAGMEGALPSVICGLVSCPVIAVPTSIGYGVSAGGFTALFGMLASCASGMTVVNIDNGFGAACAAIRILNLYKKMASPAGFEPTLPG